MPQQPLRSGLAALYAEEADCHWNACKTGNPPLNGRCSAVLPLKCHEGSRIAADVALGK